MLRAQITLFFLLIFCKLEISKASSISIQLPSQEVSQKKIIEHMTGIQSWVENLNANKWDFLCIGETHAKEYRDIIRSVFEQIKADRLILEATQKEVDFFEFKLSQQEPFAHLGAEFSSILKGYRAVNSHGRLVPLEVETLGANLDRDSVLAENVRSVFEIQKPIEKTLAVYGALHCAREDLGLGNSVPFFKHLELTTQGLKLRNARVVIPSYKSEPELLALMSKLELKQQVVVLINAIGIDPIYYRYNSRLLQLFRNYDDLIIDLRNTKQ